MVCSTSLVVGSAFTGVFIIFALWLWFKLTRGHYWKTKNVPCVSPMSFLSIFTGKFSRGKRKAFYEMDIEWCQKHGRVFGAYIGLSPLLMVADPEHLRNIFVKDFHIFQDRRTFNTSNKMLNSFLSALNGEEWKRVRSVVTPSFSTGKLKKMINLMKECAVPTTNHFLKAAETGTPVECKRIFGAYALDIIASAAFGTKLDSASDPDNIFVTHAKKIFINEFPWRALLSFVFPKFARTFGIEPFPRGTLEFFVDLTNAVVENRNKTKERRGDFLQSLMDAKKNSVNGNEGQQEEDEVEEVKDVTEEENRSYFKQYTKNKYISADEFVAQCVLFFLAGYDTTATTISMTVYFLALNPKCQEEVVKEVDAIWKKYPELSYEALNEMKYVDAAISETLRMAPPATRTERKTLQDYALGDTGITITKDMYINIPIFAMHYDPEFFPSPKEFQPERFLPENKHLIQPYTYLPFGAGPRNCIGMRFALMEIKICLLHVFRAVTFESCSETKVPVEVFQGSGLYQPKAITLKVNKRDT